MVHRDLAARNVLLSYNNTTLTKVGTATWLLPCPFYRMIQFARRRSVVLPTSP